MTGRKRTTSIQIMLFAVLSLGIGLLVVSAFSPSSSLAILGMVIISLGAILLYITPVKHVPLTLLNASAEVAVAEIERLISELNLTERGVYLPPKNLKNESSLTFIPKTIKTSRPAMSEETNGKILTDEKTGVLITPPGAALSRLFEKELGFSFTSTDLKQIQNNLPRLLVEDMELAESAEVQIQGDTVTVEVIGSVLDEICRQTDLQPKTHMQVGCLLSSALACNLAKAARKPVIIQNETRDKETKTTRIEYRILNEKTMQFENMQLTPLIRSNASLSDRLFSISENGCLDSPAIGIKSEDPDYFRNNSDRLVRNNAIDPADNENLEIEIAPDALDYFKKNGHVFILSNIENPQYSYFKIKGYDPPPHFNLIIKFEEFVLICKTCSDFQSDIDSPRKEFITKTFGITFLPDLPHKSVASCVAKSGFSTVDDWIKALKEVDDIPACSEGNKLFYLYHIQAIRAFAAQSETEEKIGR